jgi:hypothetical protein
MSDIGTNDTTAPISLISGGKGGRLRSRDVCRYKAPSTGHLVDIVVASAHAT